MGRITPVKNLIALMEAWAMAGSLTRDWILVLAGAPEFGYEVELRDRIQQLGIGTAVRAVGSIHGQDKRDAYAAAEAFVLPSLSEGFGMVILEAIATGIPALTTTGAAWERLPAEGCGWRVPPDVAGLTHGLGELLAASSDELAAMGCRARRIAERDFAWCTVREQTSKVYHWLRHGGTPPAYVLLD